MAHPQAIEVLVRRVARQVGVRRAEHWGLRGAFWGALLAAAVLAFKAVLGLAALVLAPALVLLGALAGTAYGLARRVARETRRGWPTVPSAWPTASPPRSSGLTTPTAHRSWTRSSPTPWRVSWPSSRGKSSGA